jgi:biotin carboxylase
VASDFEGKHVLLVGTGGIKRRHVLEALRSLGLRRITCLHDGPSWAAPLVDDWIVADSVRPSEDTTRAVLAQIGLVAAHLAAALELPGIRPDAAARAKDKHAFRATCVAHGIAAPRFCRVDPDAPDWPSFDAAALAFPVVVKPAHGAGSVLVRRADDRAALERIVAEHAAALEEEPAAALWPDRSALVEEYITGDEVDVDLLLQDGTIRFAAVSDNFAPSEPYFIEEGGRVPSALSADAQRELIDVAHRALTALGVFEGCIHFEARWTARGAVPIEANLRLGGAEVFAFQRGAYGVDLVAEAVRIALGIPILDRRHIAPLRHLRSMAFNPSRSGVLGSIAIPADLEERAGFEEIVVFARQGQTIRVPPNGFDYLGWLVSSGESAEDAERNLRALASEVSFNIVTGDDRPTP